jgi:hypothetical protein
MRKVYVDASTPLRQLEVDRVRKGHAPLVGRGYHELSTSVYVEVLRARSVQARLPRASCGRIPLKFNRKAYVYMPTFTDLRQRYFLKIFA